MVPTLHQLVDPATLSTLKARSSAGITIQNSSGSSVLLLGAGPSQGITAYGQINGTSVALSAGLTCTTLTASATNGAVQVGTQPQAGENVGIWSATTNSGATAGRAGQFWNTYSGTYASTAIDARAFIDGGNSQDHVVAGQFAAYANAGFTGNILEFNAIAVSSQWNAASGTAVEANELKLFGFNGTSPGQITNRWGISQMSPNSHNRFYGRINAFASCYLGTNDGSSVIGLARFSASDKYGYFNFGIYAGGSGLAQADTGGRLCVRSAGNTQVVAITMESTGVVALGATTAAGTPSANQVLAGAGQLRAAANVDSFVGHRVFRAGSDTAAAGPYLYAADATTVTQALAWQLSAAGHTDLHIYASGAWNLRFRVKNTGQIRFIPLAADPTGLEDGDVWYNSTAGKLRVRAGGATVDLN